MQSAVARDQIHGFAVLRHHDARVCRYAEGELTQYLTGLLIKHLYRSGRRGNHELTIHDNTAGPVITLVRVIVLPDYLARLDVNADHKAVDELGYVASPISRPNIQIVAVDRQRRARLSLSAYRRCHPNRLELVDRQSLYRATAERYHDQTLCVHGTSSVAHASLELRR